MKAPFLWLFFFPNTELDKLIAPAKKTLPEVYHKTIAQRQIMKYWLPGTIWHTNNLNYAG
jgi:hypothetical protein